MQGRGGIVTQEGCRLIGVGDGWGGGDGCKGGIRGSSNIGVVSNFWTVTPNDLPNHT